MRQEWSNFPRTQWRLQSLSITPETSMLSNALFAPFPLIPIAHGHQLNLVSLHSLKWLPNRGDTFHRSTNRVVFSSAHDHLFICIQRQKHLTTGQNSFTKCREVCQPRIAPLAKSCQRNSCWHQTWTYATVNTTSYATSTTLLFLIFTPTQ